MIERLQFSKVCHYLYFVCDDEGGTLLNCGWYLSTTCLAPPDDLLALSMAETVLFSPVLLMDFLISLLRFSCSKLMFLFFFRISFPVGCRGPLAMKDLCIGQKYFILHNTDQHLNCICVNPAAPADPFEKHVRTPQMVNFNKAMSSVTASIEWLFGNIVD